MVDHNQYYKRQTILEEVGDLGQQQLGQAKIIVIGAGGLGSPVLNYLVSAGVGHIIIYDFDVVEESNLHRQTLFSPNQIGQNKANVAKEILSKKNPLIQIESVPSKFDRSSQVGGVDLIVDCTDNFKTKFLAHDLSYQQGIAFCIASIHKFEGQIQFFNFKNHPKGCLRCLWESTPSSNCVETCAQAGVIGATPGVIGSIQAMEIIKFLIGMNHLANNENLIINLVDFSSFKIKIPSNPNCPICGENKREPTSKDSSFEISYPALKDKNYFIINLAKNTKKIQANLTTNLEKIASDTKQLGLKQDIVIVCNKGITSLKAVKEMRKLGFSKTYSLAGGIESINS